MQQVNINPTNLRRAVLAVPETVEERRAIVAGVNAVASAIECHRQEREKLVALRDGLRDDLLTVGVAVLALPEAAE